MLRHLSQPHATSYISSHPEVFYEMMFLEISQNLQENSCAGVSYFSNFNKIEALVQVVSFEFWEILKNAYCYRTSPVGASGTIFTRTNIHTNADGIVGKF